MVTTAQNRLNQATLGYQEAVRGLTPEVGKADTGRHTSRSHKEMDAGYVSTMSALAGSAIGALASLATTWLTQHTQTRVTQRIQDRARREALYSEFIREASKLFADAFEHELDDLSKLVQLYAIVNTIRLFAQPRTLEAAEHLVNQIGAAYFAPNKELRMFANITVAGELDPLHEFSTACREELKLARL